MILKDSFISKPVFRSFFPSSWPFYSLTSFVWGQKAWEFNASKILSQLKIEPLKLTPSPSIIAIAANTSAGGSVATMATSSTGQVNVESLLISHLAL
jgi:hypothetical protein